MIWSKGFKSPELTQNGAEFEAKTLQNGAFSCVFKPKLSINRPFIGISEPFIGINELFIGTSRPFMGINRVKIPINEPKLGINDLFIGINRPKLADYTAALVVKQLPPRDRERIVLLFSFIKLLPPLICGHRHVFGDFEEPKTSSVPELQQIFEFARPDLTPIEQNHNI